MKKERRDESFLKKPWYNGGQQAMSQFITESLKYPEEAKKNKIKGKVRLKLSIDYLGSVVEAKVQSGLGFGCDEEAIRVAKLLKFEVAKTPRKLKVLFHRTININFLFDENKKKEKLSSVKQEVPKFVYQVVTPKSEAQKPEQSKPKTPVVYTIKLNY